MGTSLSQGLQYQEKHKNENRGPEIVVSLAIMLTVAYIAVGLRFISRRIVRVKLSYDDWVIVIGLFFASGFVVGCFVMVSMGMGRHAISVQKPNQLAHAVLAIEFFYTPANTTIKFSILLLYRRLFPSTKVRNVLWAIGGFLMLYTLARMLSIILRCTSIAAFWNQAAYPNAHCVNYKVAFIVFAVVNALSDIIILSLPMPILWRLHANKMRRKQLIGIFGLGGLVCLVSICRTAYIHQMSATDMSWDNTTTIILCGVENCAGVLCACLPTMLPIWNYLHHRRAPSSARTHKFPPPPDPCTGPKVSNIKAPPWRESGNHDANITRQDASFHRLQEEGADWLHDSRQKFSPPMTIRVTTNIEMSRDMSLLENNDRAIETVEGDRAVALPIGQAGQKRSKR